MPASSTLILYDGDERGMVVEYPRLSCSSSSSPVSVFDLPLQQACVRRSEDGRGSLGFGGEPDGDEGGDVVDAVLLVLIVVAGGNTRVEKEEGSEKRGHTEVGNNVAEIVVGQLHF